MDLGIFSGITLLPLVTRYLYPRDILSKPYQTSKIRRLGNEAADPNL